MFIELLIVYVVYFVYLLLRKGYIQSLAEQLRPYIKRRRIWVGLALGPLWFLVTRLILLPSMISDHLEQARSMGSEIEQVVPITGGTTSAGTSSGSIGVGIFGVGFISDGAIGVVIIAVIMIPVALWVLFCLMMAWHNTVGIKTERRHLEALDVIKRQLQQATGEKPKHQPG